MVGLTLLLALPLHWCATGVTPIVAVLVVAGRLEPAAELADYQNRLNAMTAGQGSYTLALSHYEAVPPAVQQQLVGQYKVQEE